jgi:hypothetical protein
MASNLPATQTTPLAFMDKLSPAAYLYEPTEASSTSSKDPKLVVVCSWMAAKDVHIAKYINQHQALFPTSKILLVKNHYSHTISFAKAKAEIKPAVPVIKALADSIPAGTTEPQMLLHVFSNGGNASFWRLLGLWTETSPSGLERFPAYNVVFDSAPGLFQWMRAYRAMSPALPPWVAPLSHLVIAWFWLLYKPFGIQDPLARSAASVSNPQLVAKEGRRAYIYSEEDEMVSWRDVEAHASAAAMLGFEVSTNKFEGSKHVAHSRFDSDRYWGVVKSAWEG